MYKKMKIDELNEIVGDIYWKSLENFFEIQEEDFKEIRRKHILYRIGSFDGSEVVLDWGVFDTCYNLLNDDEKKMSSSFSGALKGLDISEKQLNAIEKFYEKFKDDIVEKVGKDNFLKYIGSTLIDSKKFHISEDNSTTDHFFHKAAINDVNLKEDYINVLIKSAISVDIKRNKGYRTILFENTIGLLSCIEEEEPELFPNTIKTVFENSHMKENKLLFINSLSSEDLKRYRNDYIKTIDPILSELKKQKIYSREENKEIDLFQDSPVFSVSLKVEALYPLSNNYLPSNTKMVFNSLAKLLKEVLPEYEFSSSFEEKESKSPIIHFSFDSRFSSYSVMKEVLPIFLKKYGWTLNNNLGMNNNENKNAIENMINLVQQKNSKAFIDDIFASNSNNNYEDKNIDTFKI